jgi:hypothetical protein
MSWDDLGQSRSDWPTIRQCHAYRKASYDIIVKMLQVCVWGVGACACSHVARSRAECVGTCSAAPRPCLSKWDTAAAAVPARWGGGAGAGRADAPLPGCPRALGQRGLGGVHGI